MRIRSEVIFVSCGQYTVQERKLGADVSELVRTCTSCEPYFAQNQNSLDGFTRNILQALDRAKALIAIMHPRGVVKFPNGSEHVRGSVWIEQEIAMAAYITQILERPIKIAPYIHADICREGMRDQLQLNAKPFKHDSEVLEDLRTILPQWEQDLHLVSPEDEIEHGRWEFVQAEIGKLNPSQRETIKLLLQGGSMTDYTAIQKLGAIARQESLASVLPGLQLASALIRSVPGQPPTRRPEYEQQFEIKPELLEMVHRYFKEHPG